MTSASRPSEENGLAYPGGPVILRRPAAKRAVEPGLHSHNLGRRAYDAGRRLARLRALQVLLVLFGLCGLGYYGYTLADQDVYQAYENWAFNEQIAGHGPVSFADYVRAETPFGFLLGQAAAKPIPAPPRVTGSSALKAPPPEGSVIGRVEIHRLNLSAMVRQGVSAATLKVAVGHVPSTALPGETGNFAIAAHRDTLFRALKGIRNGDLVTFDAPNGIYTYQVFHTQIVRPSDIAILQPNGGSPSIVQSAGTDKLLTMITCYPFYYVGAAPERFIVEAKLVSADSREIGKTSTTGGVAAASRRANKMKYRRTGYTTSRAASRHKKRRFLHKIVHPF